MRRLACLLVLVAGCPSGGGDDDQVAEDPPIPLDELCAAIAEADCSRLETCGLPPPMTRGQCVDRQRYVMCGPIAATLRASVDEGSLSYFELSARACRDSVAALPCTVGLDYALLSLDTCAQMVSATDMEGAVCHASLACGDGLFCNIGNACPGACTRFRQANETCGIGQLCAPGSFCSATGMRCRAQVDLGGACELTLDNNPCRTGGFCDQSQPGVMSCVPVRGRNQGCNSSFECIEGARCVRNRCSAGLDGDVCSDGSDCVPGLACQGNSCVVPLALDVACTMDGPPCREGLTCTSSVGRVACHPRPTIGQPCAAGDCYLSWCNEGVCAPAALPEESCEAADCFDNHTCTESICKANDTACTL